MKRKEKYGCEEVVTDEIDYKIEITKGDLIVLLNDEKMLPPKEFKKEIAMLQDIVRDNYIDVLTLWDYKPNQLGYS